MSSLTTAEKRYFEKLFNMSTGYVLDFSDFTYDDFFRNHGVDIHRNRKYLINGTSKAKKMRAFWDQEDDSIVAPVLHELLDLYEANCHLNGHDPDAIVLKKCRETILRLSGKSSTTQPVNDREFLEETIKLPRLDKLPVDSQVAGIIEDRLNEAKAALTAKAYLSVIFMCGSILEAVLLGAALQNPRLFNTSKASPKSSDGKVTKFHQWSLAQLINVACDVGLLKLDDKKFSHSLRDFRNYIHPYQQIISKFAPDEHTARICFQVLRAALASVAGER